MRFRLVRQVGVVDDRKRPRLTPVYIQDLIAREHAKPVYGDVGEHITRKTIYLGAV